MYGITEINLHIESKPNPQSAKTISIGMRERRTNPQKLSKLNGAAQIRALADEFLLNGVFSIETPIEYGSYSFVPITVEKEHNTTDYLNAAEALETGDLVISEVGDAVESIIAKNNSDLQILIEASEVLLGNGTQDRIMLESVILQPGEERRIACKCVHAPL